MKGYSVWLDEIGERWDFKGAKATIFKNAHPEFVPFGNFVDEQTLLAKPFEAPEKEWPVYGVNNKDGVFLSHMQLGADFRVPYKSIRKDWFFHNPTRANVGSLGRVPEVPDDAITSPEYQVWSIRDPQWLPDYIDALIKMPFFNLMIQVHRVGAVKERLYTRNLMEIPVPDRNRDFQTCLVEKWKSFQREVAAAEALIASHEDKLVAEILLTVGIQIHIPPVRPRAYAIALDETERWGVGFNRETWKLDTILSSKLFPSAPLSTVAYINPRRTKVIVSGSQVSFVPMEAVSEISGAIENAEDAFIEDVSKGYTAFEEDVIWAKITPCMQNGKSAVARNLKNGVGFGSTEFHVIRAIDPDQTLPDYLWVILRLLPIRSAAQRYFIGSAGQQRVPSDFLEDLVIPLPPKDVQKRIVDGVLSKRIRVEGERKRIEKKKAEILLEIQDNIISGVIR